MPLPEMAVRPAYLMNQVVFGTAAHTHKRSDQSARAPVSSELTETTKPPKPDARTFVTNKHST